jgi:ABC-type transport system involved in multi-copper enzyme maturation permease subunit
MMTWAAYQALFWAATCHVGIIGIVLGRGALAIAGEKDRQTLGFVLATRLNSAEIVLGKLAWNLLSIAATVAAGLPLMLLLHVLGGVDLRLILLTYAVTGSLALFLTALAIWVSIEARDGRRAMLLSSFWIMAWLMGPPYLTLILPRFGLRLPEWAAMANGWLLASGPIGTILRITPAITSWVAVVDAVGRMMALQFAGTVLFLLASMLHLRPAYRRNVEGEPIRNKARHRPVWRLWPRPAVGDDPILWREMYTNRGSGLMKAVGIIINAGILLALGYGTYYYARPALVEVWQHGYAVFTTSNRPPEMNLLIQIFAPGGAVKPPVDLARTELNLFVRHVTSFISAMTTLVIGGAAAEVLGRERRKGTWDSLLATPLTARDFLKSAMLSAAWRLRQPLAGLGLLWTIGLLAGAVHPLGYLIAVLTLLASTWLFLSFGSRASVRTRTLDEGASHGVFLAVFLLATGVLPVLLPRQFSSVLLGAGSPSLVYWLSLASYHELHLALPGASYPTLQWLGINTGEGPLRVLAACLVGIIGPALGGWWCWRSALAHFDRLVGRPWRP